METTTVTSKPSCIQHGEAAYGPSLERVRITDVAWTVVFGQRDRILGDGTPNFFALDRDPNATRIKSGRRRTIWRIVSDGDGSLICKVYHDGGILQRLGSTLMGTRAGREFETALAATQAGVPVPEPIAWARRTSPPHDSIVISEELADAIPLSEVQQESRGDRTLQYAVASLFARAHHAGFVHLDGHPGNVLVRRFSEGGWRAWFVDLHDLRRVRGALSARRAVRALGQIEQYYARECPIRTRLRFLASYVTYRASDCQDDTILPDIRTLAHSVHRAARRHAVRLAWQRDRRLRTRGRYFTRIEWEDGWTARVLLTLARRRIDPAVYVQDRSESQWREVLSRAIAGGRFDGSCSESSHTVRCGELGFIITNHNTLVARLRVTVLGTPARRVFEHAHRLRHRDLPGPTPLGFAEKKARHLVTQSVLIVSAEPPIGQPMQSVAASTMTEDDILTTRNSGNKL